MSLKYLISNAAGTCKTVEGVEGLCSTATAKIVVGSYTVEPRQGNEGATEFDSGTHYHNTKGLPNPGIKYFTKHHLPKMVKLVQDSGKQLVVSVSGSSPIENIKMAEMALNGGAHQVEINLACPNKWERGKQAQMACFSHEIGLETFQLLEKSHRTGYEVGIKVAPYSNPYDLTAFASLVNKFSHIISFVTVCNTFANGLVVDPIGQPHIAFGHGYAGISGPALKPIALGQVHQWRQQVKSQIKIRGVGGIAGGQDVKDFYAVGASEVQIGTAFYKGGVKALNLIVTELSDLALTNT